MTGPGDIDAVLRRLDEVRRADPSSSPKAAHDFARLVNELGFSAAGLDPRIKFTCLVREANAYYDAILARFPDDAVAMNNLGVFLSNDRHAGKARPLFARAVTLVPGDATIHGNLRTADILTRTPKADWHAVPEGLAPGADTLPAYFDPHGM